MLMSAQTRVANAAQNGARLLSVCGMPSAAAEADIKARVEQLLGPTVAEQVRDKAVQLYAEADIFDEERRTERRQSATKAFLSDLRDLKVGDLVLLSGELVALEVPRDDWTERFG